MKATNIKLQVPEIVRKDEYYKVLISVAEDILQGSKNKIYKSIDEMSKDELLIIAESFGIPEIFKRLPIDRGRQLIKEIRYLLKSKGSKEAIQRMSQIYLGVTYAELLNYDFDTLEYDLELEYNKFVSVDIYLLKTLYDAIEYVNPIGRKFGGFLTKSSPIKIAFPFKANSSVIVKYRSVAGTSVRDLGNGHQVGSIISWDTYPTDYNNDIYDIKRGGRIE